MWTFGLLCLNLGLGYLLGRASRRPKPSPWPVAPVPPGMYPIHPSRLPLGDGPPIYQERP